MRKLALIGCAALWLSGCAAQETPKPVAPAVSALPPAATITHPMPEPSPSIDTPLTYGGDARVQVFPLDGPVINPLALDRTRSAVDNTTRDGYTVFNEEVTVYPVAPDTKPNYIPNYTVPPLAANAPVRNKAPIGKPLNKEGLAPMPDEVDTELAANPRAVKKEPLGANTTVMRAAGSRSLPILTGN